MGTLSAHGGNIRAMALVLDCAPEEILDFSANINPLGPPAWLRPVVARALSGAVHYPEPRAEGLRRIAARRMGVELENVVAGNGSSELLYALPRVCAASRPRKTTKPATCALSVKAWALKACAA